MILPKHTVLQIVTQQVKHINLVFLFFVYVQNKLYTSILHLYFFHLMEHESFIFLDSNLWTSQGSFTRNCLRGSAVGAADVEASDPSSVLSLLSSLSSGSIIFQTVKYEGLESIALVLLISVCGTFFVQYKNV